MMKLLERKKHFHILSSYRNLISLCHSAYFTTQIPSPNSNFIIGYLINSCGLSSSKAVNVSKYLAHCKSPSNPDSVLHFLRQNGFDDTRIKEVVSWEPKILCASVEKSLKPKFKVLQELQFSEDQIIQLVAMKPTLYGYSHMRCKIEFWRSLFGNIDMVLKAMQRDRFLLSHNLDKKILPNISLLRDCGLSDSQVVKFVLNTPRIIGQNLDSLKVHIQRACKLGVPCGSGMFLKALHTICCHNETTINAKRRLFMNLGWSETELTTMIRKNPSVLDISEKKISDTTRFLMKEVGCEPFYIANRSILIGFSLERRLIPRYRVVQILKAKQLLQAGHDFYAIALHREETFLLKYVLPYKEEFPELEEAYLAALKSST